MAQEMTLQELLKNDEDKRSDHGGKSGERLVGWATAPAPAAAVAVVAAAAAEAVSPAP